MKKYVLALTVICLLLFPSDAKSAGYSVAFGYFKNASNNSNYDYLDKLFPFSFATSMKKKGIKAFKPLEFHSKDEDPTKIVYKESDYAKWCAKSGADFFITGDFTPYEERVILNIHIYNKFSNEIISFTQEGKLETELFNLVDKLTNTLSLIATTDYKYKKRPIRSGRIGVITNVSGHELNALYIPLMEKGYNIAAIQCTDINNFYEPKSFHAFNEVFTVKSGIKNSPYSDEKVIFHYDTGENKNAVRDFKLVRNIINVYVANSAENVTKYAGKMSSSFGGLDYLLIISFDFNTKKMYIRCVDIVQNEVVWIESAKGIDRGTLWDKFARYVGIKKGSPVQDVADYIAGNLGK